MKKILIASGVVVSALVLTACQSQSTVQKPKPERMMKHQHERMGKHHAQRGMQHAMAKACQGKAAGDKVEVALGKRTLQGQCEIVFMPKRDQNLKSNYKMTRPATPVTGVLTDAKRAEMVKQFDLRLAQQQAKQQAIQTACQGKTVGQNVELKFAEKSISGQCVLKFKPQQAA